MTHPSPPPPVSGWRSLVPGVFAATAFACSDVFGKVEHAVLLELLTDLGAGTLMQR